MLLNKIESAQWSAPFAKKKEDVLDGDMVTILADAEQQADQFNPGKMQTAIKVKTRNGEKMVSLSQTSINILVDEFGTNDASKWVGKEAKVLLKPSVIGGKKVIVLYLAGKNWTLDEYGSPVKVGAQPAPADDIPTINVDEDEAIRIESVPF
jgi:hypothetical protein